MGVGNVWVGGWGIIERSEFALLKIIKRIQDWGSNCVHLKLTISGHCM